MATFDGPSIDDQTFAANIEITPIDYSGRFSGAAPITYALKQQGTPVARTNANGNSGASSQTLIVDSVAAIVAGDFVKVGSSLPVQVLIVSPEGLALFLESARTWNDNDAVDEIPINAGSVAGLSLSSAGTLSGTPTTLATTAGLLIQATAADGHVAYSNVYSTTVDDPPIPPEWILPLDSQSYVEGIGSQIFSVAAYVVGASSYALAPGYADLPFGIAFNTATGEFTTSLSAPVFWLGKILAINSASPGGVLSLNEITISVATPQIQEIVPYLIGKTEDVAQARLTSHYLLTEVEGTGGTVTLQDPGFMSLVDRGSTVTITMGGPINAGRRNRYVRGLPPYGSPDQ